MEQISHLIQGALALAGQEFPQESIKHILMSTVFELLLISEDLTMDQLNKAQVCEPQSEGCIVIWATARADTYNLLKISPLSVISSWETKS